MLEWKWSISDNSHLPLPNVIGQLAEAWLP